MINFHGSVEACRAVINHSTMKKLRVVEWVALIRFLFSMWHY